MKNIFIILLICTAFSAQIFAEDILEMSIKTGITYPQGTFRKYSDNGLYGNARLIAHLNSFKAISGFADLSGSFFKSTEENGILFKSADPYDIRELNATKKTSEYSLALHIGTLLGSDSRNSFFRPKVGLAGGLYLFNTQTQLFDDLYLDEDPLAEDNQTQIRVGWRGIIGTDLFFTPKWGLSFEFTYDHVLNLHHTLDFLPGVGVYKVGQTARFNSYSIGAIFPLPFE